MPCLSSLKFDCIFADPPFNFGESYSQWSDTLTRREYLKFTEEWLAACVRLLSAQGSLWVNCPNEVAARIVVFAEDGQGLTLANWCIWHYRFGQWTDRGFIRSKTHALHFVRDKSMAIWNPDSVLVPSDRSAKYGDSRTKQSKRPGLRVPLDVWGVESDGPYWGRVQGNNKERSPLHSNQLPEKYIERAIRSTTRKDSLFFTPFVGSGTEMVVARALGLVSYGAEIGVKEAKSAFDRIKRGSVRL